MEEGEREDVPFFSSYESYTGTVSPMSTQYMYKQARHVFGKKDLPSSSSIKEPDKVDSIGVLVPQLHHLVRGSMDPLPVNIQPFGGDVWIDDLCIHKNTTYM